METIVLTAQEIAELKAVFSNSKPPENPKLDAEMAQQEFKFDWELNAKDLKEALEQYHMQQTPPTEAKPKPKPPVCKWAEKRAVRSISVKDLDYLVRDGEFESSQQHYDKLVLARIEDERLAIKRQMREWPVCSMTGTSVQLRSQWKLSTVDLYWLCDHCSKTD